MKSTTEFNETVALLHERFDALLRQVDTVPVGSPPTSEALEQLHTALEELAIAQEELNVQSAELLLTQESLVAAERRYRELFDEAPDGYVVTDRNGTIAEANLRAGALFGVPTDHLAGKPLAALVAVGSVRRFRTLVSKLQKGASVERWEARLQHRGEGAFPAEITVAHVQDETGDIGGWRWLIRDVTRRKRLEREAIEAGDRERQRIGRELHDDLGQRLAGAAMLAHGMVADLQAEGSPQAVRAGRIADLLASSLRLTRQLAHSLAATSVQPKNLAASLGELCEATTAAFGVECRVRAEGSGTLKDAAVATHLFRIAQEAVTNAYRHGGARRISLHLCTDPQGSLTISDDGQGFDPAAPREQESVGLKSMKYRAVLIGATLTVQSRPGGPTAVECKFPV